jgi:hypothetical protein
MSGGEIQYCPRCFSYKHPLRDAVAGWLAWHFVCSWWLSSPLWWRFGILPPFLATAGDWIYDTRGCGCRLPLVVSR